MTNIEFFKAVASNEITDEVIAKALSLVEKDEADKAKAKAKRAEKSAEKAKAGDANTALVLTLLTSEPQTCSDLVTKAVDAGMARADEKDITPQYIARLMKNLVDNGKASRVEVKGGKGKVKAYTVA